MDWIRLPYTCKLNLDYATFDVGCIACAIFDAYRALPQLYEREITITPVSGN